MQPQVVFTVIIVKFAQPWKMEVFTLCESPEILQGKIGLHFFLNGANNEVKHYGKRFMGVLLGAGLTGHGHPTCFARKGLPF